MGIRLKGLPNLGLSSRNKNELRGIGLFSFVVFLSILSAAMVATLLYMTISSHRLAKLEENGEYLKYAYEAAFSRARYEIMTNPAVYDTVKNNGEYVIDNFEINGIPLKIIISEDSDGDGYLDIKVVSRE